MGVSKLHRGKEKVGEGINDNEVRDDATSSYARKKCKRRGVNPVHVVFFWSGVFHF